MDAHVSAELSLPVAEPTTSPSMRTLTLVSVDHGAAGESENTMWSMRT